MAGGLAKYCDVQDQVHSVFFTRLAPQSVTGKKIDRVIYLKATVTTGFSATKTAPGKSSCCCYVYIYPSKTYSSVCVSFRYCELLLVQLRIYERQNKNPS